MQADMLVYFIINLGNSSLTKKKKKKMLITRSTYLFPKPSATSHDLPQWMKLLKHPVIQVSGICDENILSGCYFVVCGTHLLER